MNIESLSTLYSYNHESGEFIRIGKLNNYGRGTIGEVVGSLDAKGYLTIFHKGKHIKLHRLAWLLYYREEPKGMIDHINGIRTDNRIVNLRIANKSGNAFNAKIYRNNSTGYKGVYRKGEKFGVQARLNGKKVHIGTYKTIEEAANAYKTFSIKHHGEYSFFNR